MIFFKKILRLNEAISIEEKLFNLVILSSLIMLAILDLLVLIATPDFIEVIILQGVASLVFIFLGYKALYKKKFNSFYIKFYIVSTLIITDLIYFSSNGVLGSSIFILLLFSVVGLLLQKKTRDKIVFSTLSFVNFIIIYIVTKIFPKIVTPYKNEFEKELDFFGTGIVVMFFLPLIIKFFKDAYDLDREKILDDQEKLVILNLELEKEKQKSEELAKIKSTFLANMSHEIRTPLNGILGMTESYFFSFTNEDKDQAIKTVQNSSKLLLSIVNDILDFSKIESGKLELEKRNFNLEILLKETLNNFLMNSKIFSNTLSLKYQIEKNVEKFYSGDEYRIKQILLNLISNAIKFTNKGEVLISLKKISESKLQFSVLDTGIGIKDVSKLFQVFSQEDSSITRKFGGTGLGLVITKNLIQLMNGEIRVESEIGKGSNFIFQIELEKPILTNEKMEVVNDLKSNNIDFSKIEILLAEDNKINQMVFSKFIKKLNSKLDIAENGLEALNKTKEKSYDIIFMDMNMPIMDGLEATRKIRELKLSKEPYIISLTANVLEEVKQDCIKAGMNQFLTKPFSFEQIKNAIENAI